MPDITLQLYLTDTLTAIDGVSVAIWNSGNTAVVDSGVTNASGQLVSTLAAATYHAISFKDDYTIAESTFVVGAVDATVIIYGDAVDYGATTFGDYRARIIDKLGGRNDAKTLSLIMSCFNEVQEFLSKKNQFEDLVFSVSPSLTASDNTYSFSDFSLDNLNEIFAIRLNDGTQWKEPMNFVAAIDWDIFVETVYPVEEEEPDSYTRRAKELLFNPTPDDTYTINIIGSLYATPVTTINSVVDFTKIDGILVNLTTAYVWLSLQEEALAKTFFAIADRLMAPYEQTELRKRYANSAAFRAKRACLAK